MDVRLTGNRQGLPESPNDKLTLWKLQALIAGFALVFALVTYLFGPIGGLFMMIFLLPLWSVALWLFLSEKQANLLWGVLGISFLLFILLCWTDTLARAVFGISLSLGHKDLLVFPCVPKFHPVIRLSVIDYN
jgi:hypothetical protein